MAAPPTSLFSPARAVVPASIFLLALALSLQLVMAASQQSGTEGTAAVRRSWPEGVQLLAAQELDLPAGDYQWRITRETATQTDAISFEANPGFVVSIIDAILVQTNEEETLRLTDGAAAVLFDDDRVVVNAESGADSSAETEFLAVELVDAAQAQPTDDRFLVGPLTVPAGAYTMVLVNLPAEIVNQPTIDAVMSDSLRPGVSIAHDDEGVPAQADPASQYDRWIVALYPSGDGGPVQAPPATTGGSTPVSPSSPAVSPTVTPTATSPATPTFTPTVTPTATSTPTMTPTYTPTVSPTPTDTPTVTPSPTPTDTPTMAPTSTPTNTPVPPTNPPTAEPTSTT